MRVPAAGREWLSVPGGTGRLLRPCGPGGWALRRGARPGNRQRVGAARPRARKRHRAGLCSHLASKTEPAPEPGAGGRVGESPVAHRRAQQAGRSLLSKTPGWSRKRRANLCPRGPGWRKSPRTRAASPGAGPLFQLQSLNCPKQRAQRSVKLYKNLNASVVESGVGRSRGLAAGDELGVRLGAQNSLAQAFTSLKQVSSPRSEGVVSTFSCLLRVARALYYGDSVAGTCILLIFVFFRAVVGNECIFRHLFQKLASCKESGIFGGVFRNFTWLLGIL